MPATVSSRSVGPDPGTSTTAGSRPVAPVGRVSVPARLKPAAGIDTRSSPGRENEVVRVAAEAMSSRAMPRTCTGDEALENDSFAVLLEAVAWRGLDNVFVPVGVFLLLRVWLTLDVAGLLARLAVIAMLLGVVLWARRQTTLRDAALAGAALFGFVVWALGDWRWVVPPAVLFLGYTRVFPPRRPLLPGDDDGGVTGEGPERGASGDGAARNEPGTRSANAPGARFLLR